MIKHVQTCVSLIFLIGDGQMTLTLVRTVMTVFSANLKQLSDFVINITVKSNLYMQYNLTVNTSVCSTNAVK